MCSPPGFSEGLHQPGLTVIGSPDEQHIRHPRDPWMVKQPFKLSVDLLRLRVPKPSWAREPTNALVITHLAAFLSMRINEVSKFTHDVNLSRSLRRARLRPLEQT